MRDIPTAARIELERESSTDALIAFMTITHPNLSEPIRVVSDPVDYEWRGHLWTGFVFGFRLLTDGDRPPETEIEIQNVDRVIGQALRESTERAKISLVLLSTDDFDLSVVPRVALAEASPLYGFSQYELVDVDADVMTMRGRVFLRDFSQEPYPGISATQSRTPALFR